MVVSTDSSSIHPSHSFFMRLALNEAWKYQFLTYPNPAVGAAVVNGCGALVGIGAHKEAGKPHAEVLAIRDAYAAISGDRTLNECDDAAFLHKELASRCGTIFNDCTIYVTLEPCNHTGRTPPCASLIEKLGFKRVVVGSADPNPHAAGGAARLKSAGVEVVEGVEMEACDNLLEPFKRWQNGRFVFFKLAQTLNGIIDGGTISCSESRRWVHKVRTKIDTLVIGGRTVRIDRPVLDSRLVEGKAPDVQIFTRQNEKFDPDIPLFNVAGRKVHFGDRLPDSGLVMIEGGEGTLRALESRIDWMVLFVAPDLKEGTCYNGKKNFDIVHQRRSGRDTMLFLKDRNSG
ncbi:bifunctional diaminohydroxyphosphoribosylaminopyrimidine deaminase/5-amino-6-(5-phosphoribosylamino)uracil reductase RibD [Hydrogenimonas sp.]